MNEWSVPGHEKQRGFGTWLKNILGITPVVPDLTTAVRWSDDPGRQLRGLRLIRWGAAVLPAGECEQLTTLADRMITLDDGLLCNTHYGQMQFLHAQADTLGEPAGDTHAKIKAWTLFLFEVALMDDAEMRQSYCARFTADTTMFGDAMLPDTASRPCRDNWDIASLFTQSCRNLRTSLDCSGTDDPERYAIARMAAVGALLHVIQDSYSQSHCERGDCKGGYPRIECQPIDRFTTYIGQKDHGAADKTPGIAGSCKSSTRITDPVTAGALVLYHIGREKPSAGEFWRDMEQVFGTDSQVKEMQPAYAGKCFGGEG